jgi:uncharacterized protein YbjQ (UPF0145 family)
MFLIVKAKNMSQYFKKYSLKYTCLALLYLAIASVCSSCAVVRLHHIGKDFPPSRTIDVVYAQRDIKAAKYEFMGEILLEANNTFITREMEAQLIEEARERGANAVIIGNLDVRYFNGDGVIYSGAGTTISTEQVGVRLLRGYLVRYL